MPNKTFDRLPDEKKDAVIQVALKEFTAHDFTSASLNDIIAGIGIAKGSFYRYFNTKQDLYDYLIAYGLEKKRHYIDKIREPADDLFQMISRMASGYIHFNLEHAELAAFMQKAASENSVVRDDYLFLQNRQILIDKIKESQKHGLINTRFSADFICFCISELLTRSSDYIKTNYLREKEISDYLLHPSSEQKKLENDILLYFQQLVEFLKHGFDCSEGQAACGYRPSTKY
ncbi:MAG: TetR/AcrR family transcriptional regulator [Sporolactobacillus sp.]